MIQLSRTKVAYCLSRISSEAHYWGEPERSPTLCIPRTTSRLLRMRQIFHVKHGVDAPPTTCMRSPKRKRVRNRCFATATDIIIINGCSVARSIEVTMVGKVTWGNSGQSSPFLVQHRQNLIDVHQIASAITSVCAFCKYVKSLLERKLSPRQGNSRHAG